MPQPWLQKAISDEEARTVRGQLAEIVEHYQGQGAGGRVEVLETVIGKLNEMAGNNGETAWKYRYITSVLAEHKPVKPSRAFARAVEVLGAYIDGLPKAVAVTEPVQIYAFPGQVRAGSIVYASSVRCPVCGLWFVPDNNLRRKCKTCSPPRDRRAGV